MTDTAMEQAGSKSSAETQRIPWAALGLIAIAAAALRFWHLGTQSIWLDESASHLFATSPPLQIVTQNLDHANPPFYYLVLGAWIRLFGDSEAGMRSLSALAGVVTVPALFLLGRELWDRRVGLLAAVLLAFSPVHRHYSQEARAYALVILLGVLSVWLLARALRTDRRAYWIGTALTASLAFHLHYSGALVLLAEMTYLAICRRYARALLLAGGFTLLSAYNLAVFLVPTFFARGAYVYWQDYSSPVVVLKYLNTLYGKAASSDSPLAVQALAGILLLGVFGYPLALGMRRARQERAGSRPALLAVCCFLVPILLFTAVARVKPLWQDRYLLVCLPGYLLLAAWSLAQLRGSARMLLGTGLAALSLWGMTAEFTRWTRGDWRSVAATVQGAIHSSDARSGSIHVTPIYHAVPFKYYYHGRIPAAGFPPSDAVHGLLWDQPETPARLDAMAAAATRHEATFLVYPAERGGGDPDLRLPRRLAGQGIPGRYRQFLSARVFVFGKAAQAFDGAPIRPGDLTPAGH